MNTPSVNYGLRRFTLPFMVTLLLAEVLLVSQTVDAYKLVMDGSAKGLLAAFGYLGQVAKWLVLSSVIAALLLQARMPHYLSRFNAQFCGRKSMVWGGLHLCAYGLLFYFSWLIFGGTADQAQSLGLWPLLIWLIAAFATAATWALMLVSIKSIAAFIGKEKAAIIIAPSLAAVVWWLATMSANLWGPMANATFSLAAFWLQLMGASDVYIDPVEKIMGAEAFFVHVANACSGYEGIGLVLAFTAVYLWVHRQEFRFPHAYLLFPLGALCIWVLNSFRIAILVLLGGYVSPEVAVGGFHSQAGWLSFIATSVGVLWLAGRVRFFNRARERATGPVSHASSDSETRSAQAVATLTPVVALLAATLITSTFSADFDYLYPLRVCLVAAALFWSWKALELPKIEWTWLAIIVGLVVAVFWGLMLGSTQSADANMRVGLENLPLGWMLAWLVFRFMGSVITVPIAEELAFRGYLLCKLSRSVNYISGPLPFVFVGMAASSLAFGALHGAWLAGTMAGFFYGLLRWRSDSIWPCIIAHGVTNAALFVFALATGRWGLL